MNKNKLFVITLILINLLLFFNLFDYIADIFTFLIKLLLPFIIGFTFAFILLPVVNFLTNHKINRKLAVFLVVVLFLLLIGLICYFIFPIIVEELYIIIEKIPDYLLILDEKITYIERKLDFLPVDLLPNYDHIEEVLVNYLMNLLNSCFTIIKNGLSYIVTFFMSIVIMIYFLIDFNKIIDWLKDVASRLKKFDLKDYLIDIRDTMQAYFKGIILVSFILIIIAFILFSIFNIDYAFMLAIIIGIMDIIPYIGPYIGGGVAVIVALTTSLEKAIIVLIIIILLQALESWLITPKVQSKSISVHPILVLLSLFLFGNLFGILGLLSAVPIVAVGQSIIKKYFGNKCL
ncbi:MAG: AI-2E family transporter [Bacilli bacterium]|nr:AI-2E family transporter [Bacilli bacterium]